MESSRRQPFLIRSNSEKNHDRMAWLYVGLLTATGLVAYAGYDYNQMDAIVTRPLVIEPANIAYDHAKAAIHDAAEQVADLTE